jgi:hypothetical protein
VRKSRYLDIALRKRVTDRFALGVDAPFVNHSGGSLDRMIARVHVPRARDPQKSDCSSFYRLRNDDFSMRAAAIVGSK